MKSFPQEPSSNTSGGARLDISCVHLLSPLSRAFIDVRIFLPPNIWVVSIRILNGVAGHGRCRSVVLWPNSFVNSRVKCNLTLTRVKVAARLT